MNYQVDFLIRISNEKLEKYFFFKTVVFMKIFVATEIKKLDCSASKSVLMEQNLVYQRKIHPSKYSA